MEDVLLDISSYTTDNDKLFENCDAYITFFKSLSRLGFLYTRYDEIKHYIDNSLVMGFELLIQDCEDENKKTYILQARFNSMDDLLLAKLSIGQ